MHQRNKYNKKHIYVEEEFTSKKNRSSHYQRHKDEFDTNLSEEDYETLAENIQSKPVDNKTIFGYIGEHDNGNAYIKYDKSIGVCVVYTYKNGKPLTITCYTQSFRKYQSRKAMKYFDEIPKGK